MEHQSLTAGAACIPSGFSVRIDVRCEAVEGDGHLVISRQPARESTAEAECSRFVEEFQRSAVRAEEVERGRFAFEDGSTGAVVVLRLEPRPGVGVVQQHVFRRHGPWVIRLTATVPVAQTGALEGPLRTILRSYRAALET